MEWNIEGDRPIWLQLCEQLTMRIISGEYPMGSKLPTVRELAAEAGVNPNTMQRALIHLEEQGLTETHRTAGRQVTENQEAVDAMRLKLARTQICQYLHGMQTLGYSRQEAADLLREEE